MTARGELLVTWLQVGAACFVTVLAGWALAQGDGCKAAAISTNGVTVIEGTIRVQGKTPDLYGVIIGNQWCGD